MCETVTDPVTVPTVNETVPVLLVLETVDAANVIACLAYEDACPVVNSAVVPASVGFAVCSATYHVVGRVGADPVVSVQLS